MLNETKMFKRFFAENGVENVFLFSRKWLANIPENSENVQENANIRVLDPPVTLIKMGSLKNYLGDFNCLFLKKVRSGDFFQKSLCQLQAF